MKIKRFEELNEEKQFGGLEGRNNLVAKIKYLSNLDHYGSADELQSALEEINDLLNEQFPEIEEML